MRLYNQVKDLPLVIDSYDLTFDKQNCTGDFARASIVLSVQAPAPGAPKFGRPCTQIALHGRGATGYGEDVTYDEVDHHAFIEAPIELPLAGKHTIATFSAALGGIDLFPGREPEREVSRHYRRWAIESAALDLALKQTETDLATVLGREYVPIRFVVSNRLGDPPTFDRIATWLGLNSDLEFKLDIGSAWTDELIEELAETHAVQILDFKGQYKGTMVDQPSDPDLYRRHVSQFPNALIEDPVLTDETRALFETSEHRITWDAPIVDIKSIQQLSFEPDWLNIKPSRFGTLESLFDTIDYCMNHDINMYGGGQTELGVGRQHIHALASLFYPSSLNDIAPRAYNHPEPAPGLPTSPLSPPADPHGFEWY